MTYESEVAALSPKFFYKMDETSGTAAVDSGSIGTNGVYNNSPTLNQAALYGAGKSVSYDGTNDTMDVATSAPGSWTAMTFAGWVKSSATTDRFLCGTKYGGSGHIPLFLGHGGVQGSGNRFNVGMYNGSWTLTNSLVDLVANATYFVAGSITSSGRMKIYVDGWLHNNVAVGAFSGWTANEIRFAHRWDSAASTLQNMSGWAIWDSQLTDAQIMTLYRGAPNTSYTEVEDEGIPRNTSAGIWTPYGEDGGAGGGAAVPTVGQIWPRGNRGV